MGIIYGKFLMLGGQKPSQLDVTRNGTWSQTRGYNPVNIKVPASAVTSGTKTIDVNGFYDVTEFKYVRVKIMPIATTSPIDGISYTNGLPNDWNIIKEIGMAISEASDIINANTTGSVYVFKGEMWAYKITPGDTINITSTAGTYTYAVMGFNNFALTNQGNYGGTHTTAGLTFGTVDCVGTYQMNSATTNSGGWGNCLMRTSTMPTLQSGMPDTLAQVRVPYVDHDNQNVVLYSDDYLFPPAEKEVFETRAWSPTTEANALTQFAYYKNGGSKIKSLSGLAVEWWLRSVRYNDSNGFCFVNALAYANATGAANTHGAAPCFCV